MQVYSTRQYYMSGIDNTEPDRFLIILENFLLWISWRVDLSGVRAKHSAVIRIYISQTDLYFSLEDVFSQEISECTLPASYEKIVIKIWLLYTYELM